MLHVHQKADTQTYLDIGNLPLPGIVGEFDIFPVVRPMNDIQGDAKALIMVAGQQRPAESLKKSQLASRFAQRPKLGKENQD